MTVQLFPIILSGGFGGRLWPVSRSHYPKQFLPLITERSLLQETALRLVGLDHLKMPTLICNERHRFIAAEQLQAAKIEPRRIFLEPIGRNTAPAIAIAAWDIITAAPDGVMLVMPSDHVILDIAGFHSAVENGMKLAQQDYLITFGVVPTAPKTGYGYIKCGNAIENNTQHLKVDAFVEKPDLQTAEKYLSSQNYLWNSGIFIFKASVFLEQLRQYAPDIYYTSQKAYMSIQMDTDFARLQQADFEQCPSDSIDYAVMEKTNRAAVIPVDMGWSDVGSWGSLWEVVSKDASGNATNGHVYLKDVSNCYIKSKKEIVAALGIDDLIIIDTDDTLLIAHMDKEQEVRDVFKKLM